MQIPGQGIRYINYIAGDAGLAAIVVRDEIGNNTVYPTYTDHLGSINVVTNKQGAIIARQNFDAWGNNRNPLTWSYSNIPSVPDWLYRGYTGHEHLPQFALINMNARLYDPVIGRMLSPDNFVADATSTQAYNRYSYANNNPLIYTDPDGNLPILVAAVVGAIAGAYMGGVMANGGDFTPWNGGNGTWDFKNGSTWSYMLGGALVGSVSGAIGGVIVSSGAPMANTLAIVVSSSINSMGTAIYNGGMTGVSASFGAGSYSFTDGSFRGIWDWKDLNTMEKIGYTAGSMANLQDAVVNVNGVNVNVSAETENTNLLISHSSISDKSGDINISVAGTSGYTSTATTKVGRAIDYLWNHAKKLENGKYYNRYDGGWDFPVRVNKNISGYITNKIIAGKGLLGIGNLKYGLGFGCMSHTARALWLNGIPTIPIINFHPFILNTQLLIRQLAIYASPIIVNSPTN